MKIRLWEAATLNAATSYLVNNMDLSDVGKEHLVVVPDRFSLLMEKMILDTLGNRAIFNVTVVGLTRLMTRLLDEMDEQLPSFLTMSDGLILTSKAIKNVSDKLLTFYKSNINFCHQVYSTLSQFKSSGVKPGQLLRLHPAMQGYKKYHDLGVIYEEYENLRSGALDANALIEYFVEKANTSNVLKNKRLYFAQFDSFTSESYEVIKALTRFADEINIAVASAKMQSNYYIYENDIYQKLKGLAKQLALTIEVNSSPSTLPSACNKIAQNLFAFKVEKGQKDDYLTVLASSNLDNECAIVSKLLKYKIVNGGKYSDFAIACADLENASVKLEKYLSLLDIPFYTDLSLTADKTFLASYIFKIFEVFTKGYSQESLVELTVHPLFMLQERENVVNRLQDYNIFGKARLCKMFQPMPNAFKNILQLDKLNTYSAICEFLGSVLQECKPLYLEIIEKLQNDGYLYSINSQMWEVVTQALDTIKREYNLEECTKGEFLKQLKLILSFKEVTSPPAYMDAVMIGDATSSFFGEVKNLYVIGGEQLPTLTSDKGLISDDDIERLSAVRKVEPSIRMINRRNRFKLFNLLTSATNSLTISYSELNDEGKSVELPSYIDGLVKIFGQEIVTQSSFSRYGGKLDEYKLCVNIGNEKLYQSEGAYLGSYKSGLQALLKSNEYIMNRPQLNVDAFKLFFPEGYTKVTQLETYFSCPFKHFSSYGLKLKERQSYEFDERDLGNLCHAMAELFVRENKDMLSKLTYQEVDYFINQYLESVIQAENLTDKLEAMVDREGTLDYAKRLVQLVLTRIVEEGKKSHFKPLYLEKNIEGLNFDIFGKKLRFVGKIDRVDVCGEYYRILDYKTGMVNPILKDLYYGDKLQLFLYNYALRLKLNKTSAGTFYFDSRYDYDKKGKAQPLLKGLVIKDCEAVRLFDESLSGSVIDVKIKAGECCGSAVACYPIQNFENYAREVANEALQDISQGHIAPSPSQNACQRCPYISVCGHKEEQGFRQKSSVSQEMIMEAIRGK